ncbi:hypothetical protein ACQR1I_32770 [Bradyrhizobium sp. HKCCYLS2038]|uniref:hypothetical protein n=1 Tax=unclassified Bradyrhizobium TaxID=2631580 RepID=UPI003EBBEEA5
MKKFPAYCPLDLDFDCDRMTAEILSTRPGWKPLAPAKRFARKAAFFEVAPEEFYARCEYVETNDDGGFVYQPGEPTWAGCSLTVTPRHEGSSAGSFSLRARFDDWHWDSRFDVPYVRSVVERLPYSQIEIVRVMSIAPGGFGPVHVDSRSDALWEEQGYAATTFILSSGGADMIFQRGTQRFAADARVFFFKDCYPHGVPPVTTHRVLLRVTGKVDYDNYVRMLNLGAAIW